MDTTTGFHSSDGSILFLDIETSLTLLAPPVAADGAPAAPITPINLTPVQAEGTAADDANVVTAFNALAVNAPATTTSTVTFLHKGTDKYLYMGPRGTPAVATNASQFIEMTSEGGGPSKHAVMVITARTVDPVFDVSAAGAFYSHSGDVTVDLGATAIEFADTEIIRVLREGASIKHDVNWLTSTTFQLIGIVDVGDTFEAQSP